MTAAICCFEVAFSFMDVCVCGHVAVLADEVSDSVVLSDDAAHAVGGGEAHW